ncbi:hypothetical protein HELRODRAFT_81324, partial [Helobdella robusta]|uniref:Major facilitator superfamily (MFS) profile domain-containing protein n=1 Tax=Helobdella robusta TaxID=6412 RepID=T1G4D0_HELRO
NVAIGLMFASNAIIQLIVNPIVGPITNRIGYSIPLLTGFIVLFVSTMTFAFADSYTVLLVARTVQGLGSSCCSVAGAGLLATIYTDDRERGNAISIALGGLAVGALVGPVYGGVMYEFCGKEAPFIILAALTLASAGLVVLAMKPTLKAEDVKGSSLIELLSDPYILITAVSICFANIGIAFLETALPIHMVEVMGSSKWEQGIAFLPTSVSYLIGAYLFGPLGHKFGRWLCAMAGSAIIGTSLFLIPIGTHIGHLIVPNAVLGFSIGMVDSSVWPIMAHLVDIRHVPIYGSVYAIAEVAYCLGFAIGPAISGPIIMLLGFKGLIWTMAVINILYSPVHFLLRQPPTKEEQQVSG